MALNIKKIVSLILPQYLIVIAFSVLTASMVINRSISDLSILTLPFIAVSFAMIGLNTLNNIIDIDLDRINKPQRPLVTGEIKINEAKAIVIIAFSLAIIVSLMMNFLSFLLIILFILSAVVYSVPPIQIRRYLLTSNFIGALLYSAIPFIMVWSFSNKEFPLIFFLFFYGLVFSIASTKDFEDIKGEKIRSIQTFPILFGKTKAAILNLAFMFCTLLFISISAILKLIEINYLYSAILSFLIWGSYSAIFIKNIKIVEEEKVITQSKIVTFSMLTVALIQLIFGITSLYI